MFGLNFGVSVLVHSNSDGEVQLNQQDVRNLLSNAQPAYSTAFLLPEFQKYRIEFNIAGENQDFEIESGIGTALVKEEWRGDLIGNLFYPERPGKFKPIIHLNGSVQLLQDARSIMLAGQGYTVLELGYNLPQYGQPDMYSRPSIPLEYVESAIDQLLKHPKVYGDQICLAGHSKGKFKIENRNN